LSSTSRLTLFGVLVALALLPLPFTGNNYIVYVLILCMFFAVLAVSWDLILGYGGELSFATTGLAATGAYGSVFLVNLAHWPPLLGVISAGVLAAAVGLALGGICLRLRGMYFALATWGFAGMVQLLLTSEYQTTGGLGGLQTKLLLPISPYISPILYYYVALAILASCAVTTFKLITSQYGLNLIALGDDEEALAASGINVVWLKVSVFGISSFWVGLAGGFYAHLLGFISPSIADFSTIMVMVIAITIIGGLGTFFGPLLAAFLLYPIAEIIRTFGAGTQALIFVIVILIALKFLRNGIVGLVSSLRGR